VYLLVDVHFAGFAPAFTVSLCDSEAPANRRMPIASVVRGNFRKQNFTMKQLRLIYILLTFGLVSCNTTSRKTEESNKSTSLADTVATKTDIKKLENSQLTKQTEETEYKGDCVRGQAEPIVKKKVYPNTTFILQPDKLSAYETVTFDNKDKLIIHNWGCEYYVLTFRFETSRFQEDVKNLPFWYQKAHLLMNETMKGLDTTLVTTRQLTTLKTFTEEKIKTNPESFKLDEEIYYGGEDSEIQRFITVDKIEKLTNKKYAIEISFSVGPL